MYNNLHIYDVSAIVYAGTYKYKNASYCKFPMGGVYNLMRNIIADLNTGKDIALCFDSKSKRKDMYPAYKADRAKNFSVYSQLEFLYEHLTRIGLACYKEDGYEADDLIYNIVERQKDKRSKIVILANDKDLAHNICQPNIELLAISSNATSLDWNSFERGLVKGKIIWRNTITAYKVCTNDKSDCIKGIYLEDGTPGSVLYDEFVKFCKDNRIPGAICRERAAFEVFLETRGNLTEKDLETLNLRMDLFFPFVIKNEDFRLYSNKSNTNRNELSKFIASIGDPRCKRTYRVSYALDDLNDELFRRARELETGEFAADKGESLNYVPVISTPLTLMEEF